MEQYRRDLLFPFVVAGMSVNLMDRYHHILTRLQVLESKKRLTDPGLDMSRMWSVRCSHGKMIFYVTAICKDRVLKSELLNIFTTREDNARDTTRYTWKKAPKLNALSVLSVAH